MLFLTHFSFFLRTFYQEKAVLVREEAVSIRESTVAMKEKMVGAATAHKTKEENKVRSNTLLFAS